MTTKNTFRKHTPKKVRRNPDLLNVRRYSLKNAQNKNGVYELTDIIDPSETADFPLAKYISEERLIGMCIGVGIGIIPLVIINLVLWGRIL